MLGFCQFRVSSDPWLQESNHAVLAAVSKELLSTRQSRFVLRLWRRLGCRNWREQPEKCDHGPNGTHVPIRGFSVQAFYCTWCMVNSRAGFLCPAALSHDEPSSAFSARLAFAGRKLRSAAVFDEVPSTLSRVTWIHDNAMSPEHYLPESSGPGCAFLDYDNDGWMDIYLVNSGPCDFSSRASLFATRYIGTIATAHSLT